MLSNTRFTWHKHTAPFQQQSFDVIFCFLHRQDLVRGRHELRREGINWVKDGEGYPLSDRIGVKDSVISSHSGLRSGAPSEATVENENDFSTL